MIEIVLCSCVHLTDAESSPGLRLATGLSLMLPGTGCRRSFKIEFFCVQRSLELGHLKVVESLMQQCLEMLREEFVLCRGFTQLSQAGCMQRQYLPQLSWPGCSEYAAICSLSRLRCFIDGGSTGTCMGYRALLLFFWCSRSRCSPHASIASPRLSSCTLGPMLWNSQPVGKVWDRLLFSGFVFTAWVFR